MATLRFCLVRLSRQLNSQTALRSYSVATESSQKQAANMKPQEKLKEDTTAEPDKLPDMIKLEETLKTEQKKFSAQISELQDKYKRALAETENVRQRMMRQNEEVKLFGIQGFCKDLIEVADTLNKAIESIPAEDLAKIDNPHFKTLHSGLIMTETQLQKVFTRHGLVKIIPEEGEKFSPHIHEALFEQPLLEGKAPGTVAVVTKLGYKLQDRTIRPAIVGIFKAN